MVREKTKSIFIPRTFTARGWFTTLKVFLKSRSIEFSAIFSLWFEQQNKSWVIRVFSVVEKFIFTIHIQSFFCKTSDWLLYITIIIRLEKDTIVVLWSVYVLPSLWELPRLCNLLWGIYGSSMIPRKKPRVKIMHF